MTTYANVGHVLLKRGNTVQSQVYTGPLGELTYDTDLGTIRVHNNATAGGVNTLATQAQVDLINANLALAVSTIGNSISTITGIDATFVSNINALLANAAVQSLAIGNLQEFQTYANATFGTSSYSDANVAAYLITNPQGSTYSNANVSAYLTTQTFYSNASVESYFGANVGSLWSNAATQATGINTITANLGAYQTYANANAATQAGTITTLQTQVYANANVAAYLPYYGGNISANIVTNGHSWLFGADGVLTTSGDVNVGGNIVFADSTQQTTAYQGPAGQTDFATAANVASTYAPLLEPVFTGNVNITGNLIVNGNTTLVNAENLIISDNIIYMADANSGNTVDIGMVGHFNNGAYQHTGLVRQASTGQWKLFSNIIPEPGNTLDFANAIYDDIQVGSITSPTITDLYANVAEQATSINKINANITAANSAITTANTAMKSYVDAVTTAWTANSGTQQTEITSLRANIIAANSAIVAATGTYSNANVAAYLSAQTTGNVGAGNLTVINNFSTSIITANTFNYANGVSILSGINTDLTTINANVTVANLAISALQDNLGAFETYANLTFGTSGYGNVNVAAYLAANPQVSTYGDDDVAAYLTTATGNIHAGNVSVTGKTYYNSGIVGSVQSNTGMDLYVPAGANWSQLNYNNQNFVAAISNGIEIDVGADTWTFANTGVAAIGFPDGSFQTTAYTGPTYSDANVVAFLTAYTGNILVGNLTVAQQSIVGGNLYVLGNLQVSGTTTTVNQTNLTVTDKTITVASGSTNASQADGAGLYVDGAGAQFYYSSIDDQWNVNIPFSAPGLFDNGNQVVSLSSGAGNLAISGANIQLSATGPGAVTTGSATAIPVITTDAYGRIARISTAAVSSTLNTAGTSGTGTVGLTNQTLTITGTNGITATASGQTITVTDTLWPTANANLGTATTNISAIRANTGAYYTWANANVAGLSNSITGANAAIVTANTAVVSYVNTQTNSLATGANANVIAKLQNLTTNVTTSANVQAAYFVGNGAALTGITANGYGNIYGTTSNVTLVAGSYSYTFDNTGTFTMPVNGDIVMTGVNSILSAGGTSLLGGYSQVGGYYSTLGVKYPGSGTQHGMTLQPAADNTTAINFLNAAGNSVGNITQTSSTVKFVGDGSGLSNVTIKTTGSWTVTTGTGTYSITVPASGTYQIWVRGSIPNGIIAYLATAVVTNTNVPVVGTQYAWVYNGGGSPIDFTSIPNQFTGTGNTIVRSSVAPSATTNRFDFGISNTSGSSQTVQWGYVTLG